MTGFESAALQTGGSLGTLIIIIIFARPFLTQFVNKSIELMSKNTEALEDVSKSMRLHDARAETRAKNLTRTFSAKIDLVDKKVDKIGESNKEYGEALVKFYNHVVAQKAKTP